MQQLTYQDNACLSLRSCNWNSTMLTFGGVSVHAKEHPTSEANSELELSSPGQSSLGQSSLGLHLALALRYVRRIGYRVSITASHNRFEMRILFCLCDFTVASSSPHRKRRSRISNSHCVNVPSKNGLWVRFR